MPFDFQHSTTCLGCSHGTCFEDRRVNQVRGRKTKFRFRQQAAMNCTFGDFMPGSDNDPDPTRTFEIYLNKFRSNALEAGKLLFASEFDVSDSAIAKVEGDVFELLEAGAFWSAIAAWNRFMDSGCWDSVTFTKPPGSVPTPTRMVAIVKLPRGYDATRLFKPEIRSSIRAHEHALQLRGMELGLSSPDIVGVRLPYPLPEKLKCFLSPIENLNSNNLQFIENAYELLEDEIDAAGFLLAVAVKRTTRSDRLYQPLFEANILKYLIENVLRGAAFRFYAHLNSFEGASVEEHYKAASLISLIRGGTPTKAIDSLYLALRPRDSAQTILNDLPLFPV
ncbi:Cfr10I/Bse634I family restriction endonuclease [Pseudomonas laurylsulfatiphila]|uniref:Cfr10I/Bse634I family restriction endonuclease n=1 Tax=Pseudomonas laurylsulfatiphila TaxID=2011015 RepID=UPI00215E07BD|nr:Cfr10I/Bse634I family restriction endonuclease [Pseudomonas laurylsulfatiphila]UVM05089.1 Cfr10I/Bse634I family restriction endonuclease [Pseudomonas laurylsulfatiphila]